MLLIARSMSSSSMGENGTMGSGYAKSSGVESVVGGGGKKAFASSALLSSLEIASVVVPSAFHTWSTGIRAFPPSLLGAVT